MKHFVVANSTVLYNFSQKPNSADSLSILTTQQSPECATAAVNIPDISEGFG